MAVAGAQQAESPLSTKGRIPGDEVSQQRAAFFALPLVITGFSALSYEMSLRLLLSTVLGSDVYSRMIFISSLLGGLALGYILFGWLAENVNPRRLLSITAALEGGIALWALGFSTMLTVLINGTVDMQEGMQAALFGLVLVLPPATLMGGTLPLLSEFFAHRDGDWVSSHSKLYGANTLGGFLGVVLSTVVLLPIFGGHGAIQIASAGNIIAAIIFLALSNLCELGDKKVRQIREPVVSVRGLLLPLATSFLVGFAALSLQVIFVRIFALSLGSTFYLLSLVLGVYFFWLALGGYLSVRRSGEVRISPEKCVLITCASLVVVGYLLQYATYANQLIRIQFSPEQSSLELHMMSLFGALSILLAVPVFCFGAFEPALVKTLSERCEHEGRLVGWCYGWSTIGALVGAMTTSFILLSHFELSELYRGVLVATAVGALLLTLWRSQIGLAVTASVLIFVSFFTPLFDTSRAGVGLVRFQHEAPFSYQGSAAFFDEATERGEVLFAADGGAVTSVAMDFPYSIPPSRTIFINGRANGNTVDDRVNMNLLGVLGTIFASPEARSVGVLGFGTGMTVGAVGRFSKFQQLTVFEFDENAPNYAPLFAEANGDIATDSRLSWKIGDALQLLQRDGEKYDVLVNRPLSPWMAGIERLYSEEFYQIVTASLAEDGVFISGISGRTLGEEAARSILFTFRKHFEEMRIFQFGKYYILVGWPEKRADDSLQETFSDQKLNSYLSSLGFPNLELLLAHELWYVPAQLVSSETQSLQKPYLSILGASDLFAGKEVDLRTLLHGKGKWYYQLLGSKRALISAVPVRQLRERLPQLIERGCGGTRVSLKEPEWRTERTLCRDAVVAAMVFGATEVPQQMKSDIAWVREFLSGVFSDSPIVPVEELSRYALFDSVFVRLDPQTLIARLGPCFSVSTAKAQECQQQLVRTLSLTGHSKQARAVLELLPAGERPAELVEYVNLNERLIESR